MYPTGVIFYQKSEDGCQNSDDRGPPIISHVPPSCVRLIKKRIHKASIINSDFFGICRSGRRVTISIFNLISQFFTSLSSFLCVGEITSFRAAKSPVLAEISSFNLNEKNLKYFIQLKSRVNITLLSLMVLIAYTFSLNSYYKIFTD